MEDGEDGRAPAEAGVGVKRCGCSELAALGEPPGDEGGGPGEERLRRAAVRTAVSGW